MVDPRAYRPVAGFGPVIVTIPPPAVLADTEDLTSLYVAVQREKNENHLPHGIDDLINDYWHKIREEGRIINSPLGKVFDFYIQRNRITLVGKDENQLRASLVDLLYKGIPQYENAPNDGFIPQAHNEQSLNNPN